MDKRIIFFCLGEKACRALSACLHKACQANFLVIVGRDLGVANDFAEDIVCLCKSFDVKFVERNEFDGFIDASDYAIAIGWRWIIPAPAGKLIVMHDSLLPRYRGFAPLVNCLINGERQIGVSAIFASKEYDCGEIIAQKSLQIEYPIKIQDAIGKVSLVYAELAESIIDSISSGVELSGIPQSEDIATYSLWRDELDYFIDWQKTSEEISRFVDAVGFPYDGAKTRINGEVVKIMSVTPIFNVEIENRQSSIGKVIFISEGEPVVVCKEGLIKINAATTLDGNSILPLKKFRSRFS